MLEVNDLHVSVAGSEILKGLDLSVKAGEVHAIMGPNGSGKSTFANVLAGRLEYTVDKGDVLYNGEDLIAKMPDVRAKEGVFLAFQYPVELPGVRFWQFMKAAVDASRVHRGEKEMGVREFDTHWKAKLAEAEIKPDLVARSVNEGFSGGEKKRAEMLQLSVLEPKLAILDETDSGLDIDALRTVASGVNKLRSSDRSFLIVTHYQRLLNYLTPDYVHILVQGKIVRSGGPELAREIEESGYDPYLKTASANGVSG